MNTQKNQTAVEPELVMDIPKVEAEPAVSTPCKKHVKDDNATFFADLKVRMNEFVNTSMDEHMTCFKTTIDKVFGTSMAVADKKVEASEVETHLPLQVQATVSE